MHACYLLLLAVIAFGASFDSVTASTISSQTKMESVNLLQPVETTKTDGNTKRLLRTHWADNVDPNTEERRVLGSERLINALKNLKDKDRKYGQMISNGGVNDIVLYAKLYSKKAVPSKIYSKLKLSQLTDVEKKTNEVYLKWSAYFDYWVNRNIGLIPKA